MSIIRGERGFVVIRTSLLHQVLREVKYWLVVAVEAQQP